MEESDCAVLVSECKELLVVADLAAVDLVQNSVLLAEFPVVLDLEFLLY